MAKMDNTKYIEALDSLINYYRKKIDKLEKMKLEAATQVNPQLMIYNDLLLGQCEDKD